MSAPTPSWSHRRVARAGLLAVAALPAAVGSGPAAAADTANLAVGATVVESCLVSTDRGPRPSLSVSCSRSGQPNISVDRGAAPGTFSASTGGRPLARPQTGAPADSVGVTYLTITY